MKDTLEQLKLIRDEYQKKVDALNTVLDLLSVDHPDVCKPAEDEHHNVVIHNEPFDFSSILDWNGNKKGGIRNDD